MRRRGAPGKRRAPAPSWATPGEIWRAGFAVRRSNSGIGRCVSRAGKGTTCSTLAVWLLSSRYAWQRYSDATQQTAVEPSIRGVMHWRQRSKQTCVIATKPG